MTIIKSISGIRGTIGGKPEENLTPIDAVKYAASYGTFLKKKYPDKVIKVVIGRDARISGKMIQNLVQNTLIGMGINCIDLGLSTTPTVEIAVTKEKALGGIVLTASHNPRNWNALKFLNKDGEFLSASDGDEILLITEKNDFDFSKIDNLGDIKLNSSYMDYHVKEVLNLMYTNIKAIQKSNFTVVIDCVNSTGGIILPKLLEKLGVNYIPLYCEPTGEFSHNPEPLEENLTDLSRAVISNKADLGIVVDPDVDRLAFIDENGKMFGEEYTLVACADYILSKNPGNTVSNLSSTLALSEVTKKQGGEYFASAVGEVHVVELMKKTNAIIGGEGNGGIILPELHYGRDAIVGIALFLSLLAEKKVSVSRLKKTYPQYYSSKNKITLNPNINLDKLLLKISEKYKNDNPITIDGVKINFTNSWVHMRKSNTEPIIRIYTEAPLKDDAKKLADKFILELKNLLGS
ncbi:MAG: phosphoglucosamine mutase [Flavobacteriaceae bacterium]|nr:phosphoglucosamine mutase [Flavobacteriaceae bacterium]